MAAYGNDLFFQFLFCWTTGNADLKKYMVRFALTSRCLLHFAKTRDERNLLSPPRMFYRKVTNIFKIWPSKTPMNGCLSSGISIEFFYVNSWEIFHWFHFDRKSIIYFIKNIWNFQIPVESRNYICAEKAPAWQGFKKFLRSSNPVGNQLSKLMKTREQGVKYVQS